MPENVEAVERWFTKLESGDYSQAEGHLHVKDTFGEAFCCLGLACRVAKEMGVDLLEGEKDDLVTYEGNGEMLPRKVMEFFGFATPDGQVDEDSSHTLASHNDDGMSFEEIAAVARDPDTRKRLFGGYVYCQGVRGKIYHRNRHCQNLQGYDRKEVDRANLTQKYKPCKLCKPDA